MCALPPADAKKKELVKKEFDILSEVDHEYVVKCFDAYDTPDKLYLFMEVMEGGELFDRIVDKGHFSENDAKDVCFKLLGALAYMHGKGIAHRDLKPENMLMTTKKVRAATSSRAAGRSRPPHHVHARGSSLCSRSTLCQHAASLATPSPPAARPRGC